MASGQKEHTFSNDDKQYINRFIVFYTLRFLWKLYKNPVPELHKIMFSGGNVTEGRTAYSKMLKLDTYVKDSTAERLEKITGVDRRYFTGERTLVVADLSLSTWWRFVELWNYREETQNQEFIKIEGEIQERIRRAGKADLLKQQEAFRVLAYFAQNKAKKMAHTTMESIAKVEDLIKGFTRRELEQVDAEKLDEHRALIREYMERLYAISLLKKWK